MSTTPKKLPDLERRTMTNSPKNVLLFSKPTMTTLIQHLLGNEYTVIAYSDEYRKKYRQEHESDVETLGPDTDWGAMSVSRHLREHGRHYDLVLVDHDERQARHGIKNANYQGPVVGLVTSETEIPDMGGSMPCVVLRMARFDELRTTLDKELEKYSR